MENFNLKKYLAENKLLNEDTQFPDTSLTNALKIHFQVAYEKGLEAQPEDDYNSFDEKYWKNNEFEIKDTIRKYYRFPMKEEEVNEESKSLQLTSEEVRRLKYLLEMKLKYYEETGDEFFEDEYKSLTGILNKLK